MTTTETAAARVRVPPARPWRRRHGPRERDVSIADARERFDLVTMLRPLGHLQSFPRHAPLVAQGSSADRLIVLLGGYAKEHYLTRRGDDAIVSLLGADDVVWTGTRPPSPSMTSVTALGPIDALVVPNTEVHRALDTDHRVRAAVLGALTHRLRDATTSLVERSTCDAETRVARRLVLLADRWGRRGDTAIEIDVTLTQEELGSWAGLSREATVKALSQLRDDGIICTSRCHISIRDLDRLHRVATAPSV